MTAPTYDAPEMPNKPMTDEEILAVIRDESSAAIGWSDSIPEQRRARLLRGYLGEPYGNEIEGFSQVVSRDIFEVVEWALPQLLETFLAGDTVARFEAHGPEDEPEAVQRTELANHCFLRENKGFLLLHTFFKDALIQEIGVVKAYWEESHQVLHETSVGVTIEQISVIQQDPGVTLTSSEPHPEATPELPLFNVAYDRRKPFGKICLVNVPPEEFFYNPDARNLYEARMVGHRVRSATASQLVDMGFDRELVDELSGYGSRTVDTSGGLARIVRDEGMNVPTRDQRRDAERQIDITDIYIRMDVDGDGISERVRVLVAGDGANATRLLSVTPCPVLPFSVISPILMPHRLAGISFGEVVEDIQEIRTAILRAYLNALYLGIRPRTVTLGDPSTGPFCNMDELLSVVPGSNVTEYQMQAIRPFPAQDVSIPALQGLEMMKGMREERTGITRSFQGIEAPNSLNETASGLQMLTTSAGKRVAMIARIFAETGVKDLFNLISAMQQIYQDVPKTIRITGNWVPVDPTTWENEYDAVVEVGLGYGDKEASIASLNNILALQEKALGMSPNAVSYENSYEAVRELLKNMGYKNAARFFTPPAEMAKKQDPPSQEELKRKQDWDLEMRKLEVRELDVRLNYEVEMAKIGIMAQAPQPDRPEPMQ